MSSVAETSTLLQSPWITRPIRLRFLLGEIYLFSVEFASKVANVYFADIAPTMSEPCPPPEEFQKQIALVFYPSHPVKERLPRLTLSQGLIRYVPTQYERYWV